MGTILSTKPPESTNIVPTGDHECDCFMLNFLRGKNDGRRQTPVVLVNGERNSFELHGTGLENNDDGIVAVPNEIKRSVSSSSIDDYQTRVLANQTSISQLSTFFDEKAESSAIQQENIDSMASQLSLLRSQLAKTRRENKRLIGELKALRSAYAQVQADQLHWKSQASLLLERAKIFEAQLKHRDSELSLANSLTFRPDGEVSTSRRPSLTPSAISLPAITVTYSNNALPSLAEITESTKSLNLLNIPSSLRQSESDQSLLQIRPKRNCFCIFNSSSTYFPSKKAFVFLIAFSTNANISISRFVKDPDGMVCLRQKMLARGRDVKVFVLNNSQNRPVDQIRSVIERIDVGLKIVFWFVAKEFADGVKNHISPNDLDFVIEFEANKQGNNDSLSYFPLSFDSIFDQVESETNNEVASSRILTSVGQFAFAGALMQQPDSFVLQNCLQLDLPRDSYYLSQLHLALRDPSLKPKRRFLVIFTCPDHFRLLTIMQHWLTGLRCSNNKSGACSFVLAHSLRTSISERSAVMEALKNFTRVINDRIELRPLIHYPSVASGDKVAGDFLRSLQSFVGANTGKFGNIVIVIHISDRDETTFDKKQAVTILLSFLNTSLPPNCRVFIFSTGCIEEIGCDDEKLDTASQMSGSSEQVALASSNMIRVAAFEPSEYVSVTEKLVHVYCKKQNYDDDLERRCLDWMTTSDPQQNNFSLTLLNAEVRFICHLEQSHKKSPPLKLASHSEADCLLEIWKHILVENCFGIENSSVVVELVTLLAVSEEGLRTDDILLQIATLDIDFWFRFVAVLEQIDLILCSTGELDCFVRTELHALPMVTYVKIQQQNQFLAIIERDGNLGNISTQTLTHSRQTLMQFYLDKLSSGTTSSHDMSDLLSMVLIKRPSCEVDSDFIDKTRHSLLSNPLAMHLLFHSGDLVLVHASNSLKDLVTASTLSECQKLIMLNKVRLAPGTLRAHLLMSLANIAADFGFVNLSVSFLADALDTIRSEADSDKSLCHWATSILAHLMIANITMSAITDKSASLNTNGYRSTAERNVSSASKLISRHNNYKAKNINHEENNLTTMAAELFSSHIAVISLQLKQLTNNNNNKLDTH